MVESLLHIMTSGLLIGVIVSAPMGPIGMLVIQRTLNKGRWAAFFTGLGAALSDLTYSLLTGLGLSFVTDFIMANELLLQILGSVVLICFGAYLFRKNPTLGIKARELEATNYWSDFVTGFLFTFANPLILFFIIGLFARFNFLLPEYLYYHYILGYISIFVGAMGWWWLITFVISKVRSRFNVKAMRIMNRIIGCILIGMAIVGLYKGIKGYMELEKTQIANIVTTDVTLQKNSRTIGS